MIEMSLWIFIISFSSHFHALQFFDVVVIVYTYLCIIIANSLFLLKFQRKNIKNN